MQGKGCSPEVLRWKRAGVAQGVPRNRRMLPTQRMPKVAMELLWQGGVCYTLSVGQISWSILWNLCHPGKHCFPMGFGDCSLFLFWEYNLWFLLIFHVVTWPTVPRRSWNVTCFFLVQIWITLMVGPSLFNQILFATSHLQSFPGVGWLFVVCFVSLFVFLKNLFIVGFHLVRRFKLQK